LAKEEAMAWNWLKSMWPRKKLRHWNIVLYTREGCHLCEQAWEQLERQRRRFEFDLRLVDVDADAELVRQYGECVPVVVVNDKVRFRGVVNPVLLRRLLEAGVSENAS
jgi:glutaredoxin